MRRGGFGALLAFTVAMVMFNGQGGSSTGSTNSASSSVGNASANTKAGEAAPIDRGICELRPGKLSADHPCGPCKGFCPADDLLGTIGSFFYRSSDAPPKSSANANRNTSCTGGDLQSHWNVPCEVRGKLRFIIATAPDPTHTHLTLPFDREIAALIEGAQREGYLFARSFLPWDSAQHPESTSLATRSTAANWQSQKESLPGLLIFRKALPKDPDEAARGLFVFVAGESPTSGINKQQFLNALDIMASIRKGAEDTSKVPLLILGPSFSGSLYSLRYMLETYPDKRPIIIHSGSASSFDTIQWFQSNLPKANVVFRTFHESDQYALQHFVAFIIGQQKYAESDIALLTEDETAYGNQSSPAPPHKPGNSDASPPDPRCKPGDASSTQTQTPCAATPHSPSGSPLSRIAHFYFPRDISHLRSAYQQQIQSANSSNAGSKPSNTTLPLNLEDTGNDDDSVPTYAPGQTPLSDEAVLQGIVSSLQLHHSFFVVLQATNPLDTLFLSHYLRRAYPEGRIVTMGEDSLLSREVDDPRFQGILALTSYSLLPGVDDRMPKLKDISDVTHSDLVFPWDYSVGAFNAIVALLHDPPLPPACTPQTNECKDLPPAVYAEYGWPAIGGKRCDGCTVLTPTLWLTTIGSNGYWPVALLDSDRDSATGNQPPSQIHAVDPARATPVLADRPQHVPHPWKMLCAVFLAVIILYLFLRYRGSVFAISKIAANFAPVDDSFCNYGLLIADIMFYGIFFFLLSPWRYVPFRFNGQPLRDYWFFRDLFSFNRIQLWSDFLIWRDSRVWYDALWFFLIVLVIVSFIDFLKRGSYWFAGVSMLFVGVFFWISHDQARKAPSAFQNLSFYRYVHITSGVSPIVPFLILAIAGVWWAWYTLAGLVLTDKRGPLLPDASDFKPKKESPNLQPNVVRRFHALTCQANRALVSVARPADPDHRVILLPLLALAFSCLVIDFSHPVRSLEGRGYDWAYAVAFTGVLFVLLCDLFRLVVAWMELRSPLMALDRLTLRRGFLRLEELKMKPIWRLGGSAFDDFFSLLGKEVEALRTLDKFLPDKNALKLVIAEVENSVEEFSKVIVPIRSAAEAKQEISVRRRLLTSFKSLARVDRVIRSWVAELRDFLAENIEKLKSTDEFKDESGFRLYVRSLFAYIRRNDTSAMLPELEKIRVVLARACAEALLFLSVRWNSEIVAPADPAESSKPVTEFRFTKTSLPQSTQIAEDFVCLFYYNFISSIFLRLRTLLMSVAGMFVFLVLSFNSYPFEPQTSCQTLMIIVFILIVSLVAFVLGQMSRDTTLSHITNTTPGELGWEFWIRMASFVAIPLLSLLSAQFPQIGGFLFSWAEPALNTFK
jgi:hypothetical protein